MMTMASLHMCYLTPMTSGALTTRSVPGDVVRDDISAADHVLGVLLQPGVLEELVAVVRVLRLPVRHDDALHLHGCSAFISASKPASSARD